MDVRDDILSVDKSLRTELDFIPSLKLMRSQEITSAQEIDVVRVAPDAWIGRSPENDA